MTDAADQARLGLRFRDNHLWRRALTHPSYVNEHKEQRGLPEADNQRLEFLGDAIIDFVVAEWLYQQFPGAPEGDLSRLRIALVRTESLAELAHTDDLGALLLLGRGEEAHGGRSRVTNLCDLFEAICGALYLDQGLEAVRAFIVPRMAGRLAAVQRDESDRDAKTRLQEWAQATLSQVPTYRVQAETAPAHEPLFIAEVLIGSVVYGVGRGSTKRAAQQAAAGIALAAVQKPAAGDGS